MFRSILNFLSPVAAVFTLVLVAFGPGAEAAAVRGDSVPAGLSADDWHSIRSQVEKSVIGTMILQQSAYLKASNTDPFDDFTWSVDVSGDTVVVGARREDSASSGIDGDPSDDSAGSAGAVYVFVLADDAWSQQAYLKADNAEANDQFGHSVAISGDLVVVGAPVEGSAAREINGDGSNNAFPQAGAAYVFSRQKGQWFQDAYLKAFNAERDDRFGDAVAISGDTVVVGAPQEDADATGDDDDSVNNTFSNAGAAYVFQGDGISWWRAGYLKAANAGIGDRFGEAVAIDGDTIVVGAPVERSSATGVDGDGSDDSAFQSGAAYVYTRTNGAWTQAAYLKASNSDAYDRFGDTVAVSAGTVVVGAPNEGSHSTGVDGDQTQSPFGGVGAAYVFTTDGPSWSQQAYLKASNAEYGDYFGHAVAVADDTVVVTADREGGPSTGVYGAQGNSTASSLAGAAYVFTRDAGAWSQTAYVKASNTDGQDFFGSSVAISGDRIVVGANGEDSPATGVDGDQGNDLDLGRDSGAAYVFETFYSLGGTK